MRNEDDVAMVWPLIASALDNSYANGFLDGYEAAKREVESGVPTRIPIFRNVEVDKDGRCIIGGADYTL